MQKPVLISGIQPTGALHVGNYLGALKNFVALQNTGKYRCLFFVADYHSLTEDYKPREKPKQVLDVVLSFLAAGIDPKRSTIFVQSAVPAHAELVWILNTITPMGELFRMTQLKDKISDIKLPSVISVNKKDFKKYQGTTNEALSVLEKAKERYCNAGLFDYPVLMVADILLYDAKFVPVGEDQLQHLELARTLARKFNAKFPAHAGGGKTFTEPKALHTEVPRLMGLDDPTKKMSKSRPAGCLFLDDSPAKIRQKLARATTDSGKEVKYDPERKPGVSNLIRIYADLTGMTTRAVGALYAGKGYAEFKRELAEIVVASLEPFQRRKAELKAKNLKLKTILAAGNRKANALAEKKLFEVKRRVGLVP